MALRDVTVGIKVCPPPRFELMRHTGFVKTFRQAAAIRFRRLIFAECARYHGNKQIYFEMSQSVKIADYGQQSDSKIFSLVGFSSYDKQ